MIKLTFTILHKISRSVPEWVTYTSSRYSDLRPSGAPFVRLFISALDIGMLLMLLARYGLVGMVKLIGVWQIGLMKNPTSSYLRLRLPSEILGHSVGL